MDGALSKEEQLALINKKINVAVLNENSLAALSKHLSAGKPDSISYGKNIISFSYSNSEDKNTWYVSLPPYGAWEVKADDTIIEKRNVRGGIVCDVPDGTRNITVTYSSKWFNRNYIISLVFLVGFILSIVIIHKRKKMTDNQ